MDQTDNSGGTTDSNNEPPKTLEGITSKIPGTLDDKIVQGVGDTVQNVTDKVQDAASNLSEKAGDSLNAVTAKAQDMAATAVEHVQNAAANVSDQAQDVASSAVDTAQTVAGNIADKAQDAVQAVVPDHVEAKAKGFWGKLKGLFSKK